MLIALFPLMLIVYRNVINALIDLGKLQTNATTSSGNATVPGEWYV